MDHIVLFSGSVGSLITLRKVEASFKGHKITPAYFPLGETNVVSRERAVKELAPRIRFRAPISGYNTQRSAFLCLAAAQLIDDSLGVIWLAVGEDDPGDDAQFRTAMSKCLSSLMGKNITVQTPWQSQNKVEMVEQHLAAGHSHEELLKTWSCWKSSDSDTHCGECPPCVGRYVSFSMNGIEEKYQTHPPHSVYAKSLVEKALRGGAYSSKTTRAILATLHEGGEAPQLRE